MVVACRHAFRCLGDLDVECDVGVSVPKLTCEFDELTRRCVWKCQADGTAHSLIVSGNFGQRSGEGRFHDPCGFDKIFAGLVEFVTISLATE